MKILQVSTYDIQGGAGRAAYRLHRGLIEEGSDSWMLVRFKKSTDRRVCKPEFHPDDQKNRYLHEIAARFYRDEYRTDLSDTIFTLPLWGYDLSALPIVQDAQILNLHWVLDFQSTYTLKNLFELGKPVIWTLHDQWPFTGGCHYSAGCEKYRETCNECPQLSGEVFGVSSRLLHDKESWLHEISPVIVSPSQWLAECARSSRLFRNCRVELIPNGLETDVFRPFSRTEARKRFGIGENELVIMFCADTIKEKRKGFDELTKVIQLCLESQDFFNAAQSRKIRLVCLGRMDGEEPLGIPLTSLGHLESDDLIAQAYSSADLFVLPSLEDNLPNTILESMSCGTPVLSFRVGGVPDVVKDGLTGWVVQKGDIRAMADRLLWLLDHPVEVREMRHSCRNAALELYSFNVQAGKYSSLYEDVLGKHRNKEKRGRVRKKRSKDKPKEVPLCFEQESTVGDIVHALLLSVMKDWILRLEAELGESNADRAERLKVIRQYEHELGVLNEKTMFLQDKVRKTEQQIEITKSENKLLSEQIKSLYTTERAMRVVVKNLADKYHLSPLIERHYTAFNRAYLSLFKPGGSFLPKAKQGEKNRKKSLFEPSIHSPLVEAFVEARFMEGGLDDVSLERLFHLGADQPDILCIGTSPAIRKALFMLSRGGAQITVLSDKGWDPFIEGLNVKVHQTDLNQWIVSNTSQSALEAYDWVLFDHSVPEEDIYPLIGRLRFRNGIMVTGPGDSQSDLVRSLEKEGHRIQDLLLIDPPFMKWLNPLQREDFSPRVIKQAPSDEKMEYGKTMPTGRPWPKISVVTVTFNAADYLEETIQSVLSQRYPNLEYIVIDGGSTDGTMKILDRYREKFAYCISERDKGQSDALNKGFGLCTGDILAWLNADDLYRADTLFRVAIAFDLYGADIVAGGCAIMRGKGNEFEKIHHNRLPLGKVVALPLERLLDIEGAWLRGDFFYQPEVFWSRGIWEKVGSSVDEGLYYSMDYALWVQMAKKGGTIVHIPDILAIYRFHKNQKTDGDDIPYLPELKKVAEEFKKGFGYHES